MPRKYERSPIIEAICEIAFDPSSPWDLAVPGLIYEQLRGEYPKRQGVAFLQSSVTASPIGMEGQIQQMANVQFISEDAKMVVQVGPHLLSIHRLQPYNSWDHFLPIIIRALGSYVSIAAPKSIQRIALRYINDIAIPGDSIELKDYFDFYPYVGANLPQDYGAFIAGIQGVVEQQPLTALNIQLGTSTNTYEGKMAFTLNVSCIAAALAATQESVAAWLGMAHTHVENAFEGAVKDTLRQLLGVVN